MATIIVGVEDSPRSEDAVALAGELARTTGGELLAVCAYPFDDRPAAHFNLAMREPLRAAAIETLDRVCEPLSDLTRIRRIAVADRTPARALVNAAVGTDAPLIVVGSSHAGDHGQVRPGDTGRRLLQGAPCSVALAPQGQRLRPHPPRGAVGVAFDGSPGAYAALYAAARLARAFDEPLRIIDVFEPDVPTAFPLPPGFLRVSANAERAARDELARAVSEHPGAAPRFVAGDPAEELARESDGCRLMVVGSRGYGPAPAVVLGGVSGALAQTAACPLLVVAHGLRLPLATLGRAAAGTRTPVAA